MVKYDPLKRLLAAQPGDNAALSFAQIEQALGAPLPTSAHTYRMWWSNERGPGRYVQAQAWLGAGWRVQDVSLREEIVTFRRDG